MVSDDEYREAKFRRKAGALCERLGIVAPSQEMLILAAALKDSYNEGVCDGQEYMECEGR